MPGSILMKSFGALLCLTATLVGAAEPEQGFAVTPVAGSVTLLQGYECNVLVSTGEDGIVVVDTCSAQTTDKLLAAVQRLSSKPIRFAIDTHVHGDHTGGNAAFQRLAPAIAHHNVTRRMLTGPDQYLPGALPRVTFKDEMWLHLNDDDIRLLALPAGHTDTDVVVFFGKANVVHMGDVFMSPAASFVDVSNGGTVLGLIEELEFVLPQIPADAQVVPGHGLISTRADVSRALEILKGMRSIVENGMRAGKTLDQLIAEKPFDRWQGSTAPGVPLHVYVQQFFRELSTRQGR